MNRAFFCLLFICLIVAMGCGGEENTINRESKKPSSKSNLEQRDSNKANTEQEVSDESTYTEEVKNNLPQITSIKVVNASDEEATKGFKAVVESKDSDGDDVSFRYQWKRNGEDIVGAVGEVIEWEEDFKKGDNISIQVIPFDGKEEGVWKTEGSFIIPNSPPKIVSAPDPRTEGGKFTYTVKAEDPDGDPVELILKNAPKGMTIEPATGVITWELGENDVGEYKTEIIASDPEGAKDIQIVNLTVPSEAP